ncbi:MAG TPA: hypothetical protein VMH22_08435 [bacterium]|nr:hypothetical protein [bacterium]
MKARAQRVGHESERRFALAVGVALTAALGACWLCGCGTAAAYWPLRRGQSALALEAGGPVVNLSGAQLPVPYPVARFRYGVTDRFNVNVGAHLLMPAFGVAGFDGGASYHFLDQAGWRPCVGVAVGEIGLIEFDGRSATVFMPQADVTASYLRANHSLSYFGVHTLYQIRPSFHMTFSPYVGHNFSVGRELSVGLELKWYAAYERAEPRAVKYSLPIANHGGLGFVGGITYHFGGWYR